MKLGAGLAALALALAACGRGDRMAPAGTSPPSRAGSSAGSATDPWAAGSASPDDPPTLAERREHADRICPTITAPYFYELAKNGKVSHILGTRHIGVALAKFPQVVRDDLHAAKLAVFEVAPDDDGAVSRGSDADLHDAVGDADWKHYTELVGSTVASTVRTGRPATAVIEMMVMYEDIGQLLESQLQRQLADDHIPSRGLETSAFQDRVLDHLLDLRMLRSSIEQTHDRKEIETDSTDDLRDYCAGVDHDPGTDAPTRRRMLASGYTPAELDAIDDELVYARNRDWIPKLETIFAQGDVFVAVGADHLLGNRGVIALLKARGFTAKRITK